MSQKFNKKKPQIEDIKNAKQLRRKQPSLERNAPSRPQKSTILIVCEGKNTEPSYFNCLIDFLRCINVVIIGAGRNTISLVAYAEKLHKTKYQDAEVCCVFDSDPDPSNSQQLGNFKSAIKKAESLGFHVAYSCPSFEYWILLHFEDHQGGSINRNELPNKINKYLQTINPKVKYDKDNKIITQEVFDILRDCDSKTGEKRYELAIKRARKISEYYDIDSTYQESATTVFKLVERLMEIANFRGD